MRRPVFSVLLFVLILGLAAPAAAQQCGTAFVEPFDDFSNAGAWGWSGTFQASLSTASPPG